MEHVTEIARLAAASVPVSASLESEGPARVETARGNRQTIAQFVYIELECYLRWLQYSLTGTPSAERELVESTASSSPTLPKPSELA